MATIIIYSDPTLDKSECSAPAFTCKAVAMKARSGSHGEPDVTRTSVLCHDSKQTRMVYKRGLPLVALVVPL